jgi:hypothetical protein
MLCARSVYVRAHVSIANVLLHMPMADGMQWHLHAYLHVANGARGVPGQLAKQAGSICTPPAAFVRYKGTPVEALREPSCALFSIGLPLGGSFGWQ